MECLISTQKKHNKIKNTGILFELLTRQIAVDVMNDKKDSPVIKIIKEFFNDKTQLGKENELIWKANYISHNRNCYHAPEPGAKKFVEVGKKIKKGDTIMIIEAMKTMNHVPSTADGIVKEICVDDGQPVEFGQTIIILE